MGGALHSVRKFLWGEKPSTKEEQRLLNKIDAVVLSFLCLQYLSNYLNRANFANAYVTGMREDLGFKGTQYNQVNTVFTIGYIVGQLPNALILQFVPPRIWLPFCGIVWGGLSACTAAAKTPQHVMAIRFFQAIFESSTFSGSHWVLGCWYKESELGKRSGIFATAAQFGQLFSGVMQGRIATTMEGHHGLHSYQWLFIIDCCIAIPIAIFGFIMFPDTPRSTKAWFLTEEERQLAIARLPEKGKTKMSWDLIKRVLGRWHWYGFSALFGISALLESVGINGIMGLWFQYLKFEVSKRNYYPLSLISVAIVITLICATWTDHTGKRWPVNIFMAATLTFCSILLLIWDIPYGLKFFALALSGAGYAGQATNFAWANIVCRHDDQERAVVLYSMNMWSNVVIAWWGIVLFPATSAPKFRNGWIGTIVVAFLTVIIALVCRHLDNKERREERQQMQGEEGVVSRERSKEGTEEDEKKIGFGSSESEDKGLDQVLHTDQKVVLSSLEKE
ncbi:MFS general substrate transporter [Violaceomyces palustris]|uniref:MFS general substrate transporter n=1 Tax=Violaceomyces palustris TaxID=1673888 RepID=A0ACD0P656_9BASI|nr:MFS general substrate transporter [Violaceomyces palustris]